MAELVGILNITPDSFSDGGRFSALEHAVQHAERLYSDGAHIIDVGAESTRPGAMPLSWQEEIDRLTPFIDHASQRDWNISLDTYHPQTVRWAALRLPSFIINDVTGFRDVQMREAAAASGNTVVVGHLPLASADVRSAHGSKPIDSAEQVVDELSLSVDTLIKAGVAKSKIIVDPGIGFGKAPGLNWELLKFGEYMEGSDVMIGYSRKRFLGQDRMKLGPNLVAGRIAVQSGAAYLRVHDVLGHAQLIR